MTSRRSHTLVALAAVALLAGPRGSSAWVAVRVAPRVVGGAAVGLAAGAVAGAAVASASTPSTVVVQPPPTPPPTAPPPTATPPPATTGSVVTTLPPGCVSSGGRFQCGSVWYQPYFGGNGVYYQAVPP